MTCPIPPTTTTTTTTSASITSERKCFCFYQILSYLICRKAFSSSQYAIETDIFCPKPTQILELQNE